jgi:hypothetical protein
VLSGHILSVTFGTLSIALTYSLVRRLFPEERTTAAIASLTLALSFWSLMYSRTAIRHISLPPFILATIYALWRQMEAAESTLWGWALVGLLSGVTLYTYTASRLLPVLLVVFAGYLALSHPRRLRNHWRGFAVAVTVIALTATPLGVAIAQGRTERAIQGIGADARLTELARPVRALQNGDLRPLLASTVKTLGMFHARGDPEWLYNIPERPVFDLLGGALLWSGVALCLYRWRQPRYFLLLPWLGLGLSPAFISTPAGSLSHTILAQPVAYILPALALVEFCRWLRHRGTALFVCSLLVVTFVSANAIRDLRDYFVVWPERGMVRLLYRADIREAANFLDVRPDIDDIAISSALMGPWDRIALQVDIKREDIAPRLFNPQRALVWVDDDRPPLKSSVLLLSWPDPISPIESLLEKGTAEGGQPASEAARDPHLTLYTLPPISEALTAPQSIIPRTEFANGLTLTGAWWLDSDNLAPGNEATLLTTWHVDAPLDLPPIPIVAQPPPPKTYSGPRLAIFVHLLETDGGILASDDGLWVDPLTLQPGDRFVQAHHLAVPDSAPDGPYALEVGLYDPKTDERLSVVENTQYGCGGEEPTEFVAVFGHRDIAFFSTGPEQESAPAESMIRPQDGRPVQREQAISVRRSREDS